MYSAGLPSKNIRYHHYIFSYKSLPNYFKNVVKMTPISLKVVYSFTLEVRPLQGKVVLWPEADGYGVKK